jgi:NAD+ kinase
VTLALFGGTLSTMRIALIPNLEKPDAVAASATLAKWLGGRADVLTLKNPGHQELRQAMAQLVIVLGGDGSILRFAHALGELAVPVVGINFGKLGYLAAFSMAQFERHADDLLAGRARVTPRLMLRGAIYKWDPGAKKPPAVAEIEKEPAVFEYVALNDIVVNAGPPFRMIELRVRVDEHETTKFRSDGVIVATSSGSTAYNLSAGGPLMSPEVHAMVLTPICPHSLSFRSVVLSDQAAVLIYPEVVYQGTAVTFDGQVARPLGLDQCVVVRRSPNMLQLVENPHMNHWQMLATKLQWAQSPTQ